MAGWTCPDREVIEWDGVIKAKNFKIGNQSLIPINTPNLNPNRYLFVRPDGTVSTSILTTIFGDGQDITSTVPSLRRVIIFAGQINIEDSVSSQDIVLRALADGTGNIEFIDPEADNKTLFLTDMKLNVTSTSTFNDNIITYGNSITTSTISGGYIISLNGFSGSGALITNLNASNIASGTLAIARGGTNATTQANTGITYFDNTSITSSSSLTYTGGAVRIQGGLPGFWLDETDSPFGNFGIYWIYDNNNMQIQSRNSNFGSYITTIAQIHVAAGGSSLVIDASSNFGIGASSPGAKLYVLKTSEQFRTAYDANNYFSSTTNQSGAVTFDSVGASAAFYIKDPVTVSGAIIGTSMKITNLTAGRVPYASTGGLLADNSGLTFASSILNSPYVKATTNFKSSDDSDGISGSFSTASETVTVKDGIITAIDPF